MIERFPVWAPGEHGMERRRVYIYLPDEYYEKPKRQYPVLYMFDGHNVFYDEDATYGKSWGVADYLDYTDTPLIVAAVECNAGANNERLVERKRAELSATGISLWIGLSMFSSGQ